MIKEVSFNKQVACIVGVEKAVIIQYLAFCLEKNKSNSVNFHEGRYWTNNTNESLLKVLPFFKNWQQIRRRIDSLVKDGFLLRSSDYVPNNNLGYSYSFSNTLTSIYNQSYSFEYVDDSKLKNVKNKKDADLTPVRDVLSYFNKLRKRLGARGYNLDKISDSHKNYILSRLKEGATVDEMKAVIDLKEKEWISDFKMQKYLRVETLFNKSKYSMYVSELPTIPTKDNSEVYELKKKLNIEFGMRGIRNEESDNLAKKLIELGYNDEQYLKSFLL